MSSAPSLYSRKIPHMGDTESLDNGWMAQYTDTQTDIATYRLNQPRGRFIENISHLQIQIQCPQSALETEHLEF